MPITEDYNRDCLEAMREMPDRAFDLAIVDPPFGIGNFVQSTGNIRGETVTWNDNGPSPEYFLELKRVTRNRIIWGANYFNCFEENGGAIIWDKDQPMPNFSQAEVASCSFHKKVAMYRQTWTNYVNTKVTNHPCERPVDLYKWCLKRYAKDGDTILDTHLGSGSSRIAAYDLGFDFTGYELDKDYFEAQTQRFRNHIAQPKLFVPEPQNVEQSTMFEG
jgi:site-specific DNA-methyltransferase (adenine-specific)